MFLVNSCLNLFTAACRSRHPFSRSYGVILPSSLTIVLSLTLGFSPHLPVSVCGTGTLDLTSGFSWQREISCFSSFASPSQPSLIVCGFAYTPASLLGRGKTNSALNLSFCVPTSFKRSLVVQESLPVVHRLRLSASA